MSSPLPPPEKAVQSPAALARPVEPPPTLEAEPGLTIYSHSPLLYWWPVWVMGYAMAILTYWQGHRHVIGQDRELYHPSSNLGVIYLLTLFLVILITNVSLRGLASGLVIMLGVVATLLLAVFDMWDVVLGWFGDLKIHLNFGAYFWFSTLLFIAWAVSVFVVVRMAHWHVTPGQITHVSAFGAGSKTCDAKGMVLEKQRGDLFRNWLLGLGSGDLLILTTGASAERIEVSNVLFIGWKVEAMQRMIAQQPDASPAS